MIGKKLFQRAKKDKNAKIREKAALEKLEKVHEKNEEDLNEELLSKLQTLLKDKASAGVNNNFGEVQIGKGAKFNPKNLASIDYQNVNPLGWTGDASIDDRDQHSCCTTTTSSTTKNWVDIRERNSTFLSVMSYLPVC